MCPCCNFAESGVFGVPLHILLEQDQRNFKKSDLKVPLVFEQVCKFLCGGSISEIFGYIYIYIYIFCVCKYTLYK